MKKILKEWRGYLNEISKEEVKWFGAEFEELANNPQLSYHKTWIEQNMGKRLGGGYSRTAYELKGNPDLVWKVANEWEEDDGNYTNAEEKEWFNQFPEFFPRVWLTDDPHTPSKAPISTLGMAISKYKNLSFTRWIVVDRVIIVDNQTDYQNLILKVFPIVTRILKILANNRITLNPWSSAGDHWDVFLLFLSLTRSGSYKKIFNYFKETVNNAVVSHRRRYDTDLLEPEQIEDLARSLTDMATNDTKFARFLEMLQATGADAGDIRPGNVGTDLATKSKFVVLDISKFLDDELDKHRAAARRANPRLSSQSKWSLQPKSVPPEPSSGKGRSAGTKILSDLFKKL